MKLHTLTFTLLVIGGLNWLLMVLGFDIATWMSSAGWMTIVKIVYVLVGLSALYEIFTHKSRCKNCDSGMKGMGGQM
jgi:uncharacterized membrane protein YuzA (DUF378 family)